VLKPQHILIIRLSAMGDVAMTVPVIRALVKQHPNCKITVLSKPFLKPLFEGISNVSFYEADVKGKHKGIIGIYRLFRSLQKLDITHVADFHNVVRSKILIKFFAMTPVSIAKIDKGRAAKKALTRSENKIFKQLKTSHQRYVDVLSKLDFKVTISNPKPIDRKPLSENIIIKFGHKENKWIGVAPFAAFKGKVYPLNLMEEVIEELSSKGITIFLFGGGHHEIEILKRIESKYKNCINVAGEITFTQELELISHLDLMISMDSGNAHLAAMQQIKTITIWGVTHPFAGFSPFNQPSDYCILPDLEKYPKIPCSIYGNTFFDGYENVMESIKPTAIIKKAVSLLSE